MAPLWSGVVEMGPPSWKITSIVVSFFRIWGSGMETPWCWGKIASWWTAGGGRPYVGVGGCEMRMWNGEGFAGEMEGGGVDEAARYEGLGDDCSGVQGSGDFVGG